MTKIRENIFFCSTTAQRILPSPTLMVKWLEASPAVQEAQVQFSAGAEKVC